MARQRASDYEQKSQAIVDMAAALIAANGYDRTSMASIAAACGVSKALLYHYYSDKDSILFDIIGRNLDHDVELMTRIDQQGLEPRPRLRAMIAALLEAFRYSSDQHQVQISYLQYLPQNQQKELRNKERRLAHIVARTVSDACPNLKDSEFLMPVTMSLFTMLNWQYLWFREDGAITRTQYADFVTQFFLAGVDNFDLSSASIEPGIN